MAAANFQSHAAGPLKEMSDERRRKLEESDRLWREAEEQTLQRVRALGFSSIEECELHAMDEFTKYTGGYQKQQEEKCALLGIKMEELEAQDPQRWIDPDPPLDFSHCSCDEHVHNFCPERLVDYRSQDIEISLNMQTPSSLPKNLDIKQGDLSRRLPQELLERVWVMDSQGKQPELPFWARSGKASQLLTTMPEQGTGVNSPESPMSTMSQTTCDGANAQDRSTEVTSPISHDASVRIQSQVSECRECRYVSISNLEPRMKPGLKLRRKPKSL